MQVGMGVLQLSPAEFWSMSLPELEAALAGLTGGAPAADPLSRTDLEGLMARFPD